MNETKSLKALLAAWQANVNGRSEAQPPVYEGPDVVLQGFTEKSGEAGPGWGFVARVRAGSNGHPYIPQAIANGASLILAQEPPPADCPVPYLQVADTAETLAWLSAAWFGFPGRELVIIGVTGTDGKTTTANLIYAVLKAGGLQVGLLSTIKAVIGQTEEPLELHVTTPEAPVIQSYLRRMVDAGLTHCVLESTSHGLAQHRVTAVPFDLAVVTNITHEHLDYHGSYEAYLAAKSLLFKRVAESQEKPPVVKTAVLNRDDSSYLPLSAIPAPRQMTYALHRPADVFADEIVYAADETRFSLHLPGHTLSVASHLVGAFNVYNMLAAASVGVALGLEAQTIQAGLESVTAVSGRMQRMDNGQDFLVVVDFAHTPNALQVAILAARGMVAPQRRVIAVFGSAGKRDREKRRLMAEVSAQYADFTILTAEDPRTESLEAILQTMAEGCERRGGQEAKTFWRVADRGQAIYFALTLAQAGDIVLVCGKGHEQSMCFGTIEYPWDDRHATETALAAFLRGQPMPDLGLPTFKQ